MGGGNRPCPSPVEVPPAAPSPAPAVAAVGPPSFNEVMAFNGAPEIINGRLSMFGFVAALGAELSSGESVLRQITEAPTGIICSGLLLIIGSLVPVFMRSKQQSVGPFTPSAEMINGRAAMIGFAALLAVEVVRGTALFAA
ncbi:chloroplast carotene biosynthesis related protein [Haematococcus lacustris]|uniref:Chloroplast carotene biosynthesis related protein n=1 Tax=Haematococcus lacustris TaxID=44745 RepID=A0A699Z646_HAELA|nr:chloroplast carotene biosynthesis related protein [Haematococcus lacustris]